MKKRLKVFKTNNSQSRYKYYISFGSPPDNKPVYVFSALVSFTKSGRYITLPRASTQLVVEDDIAFLKPCSSLFTFNCFLQAGTDGSSKIIEIKPNPISTLYYKIIDARYSNSVSEGILFTIDKPIAVIRYRRDGKEFPVNLSKGVFTMTLDGNTKFLKEV